MKNMLMFDYEYQSVWHSNFKNNTCKHADKNTDKLYPYCQIINKNCLFKYPLPDICGELKKER